MTKSSTNSMSSTLTFYRGLTQPQAVANGLFWAVTTIEPDFFDAEPGYSPARGHRTVASVGYFRTQAAAQEALATLSPEERAEILATFGGRWLALAYLG